MCKSVKIQLITEKKRIKSSLIGIILTYVEQGQEIAPAPNNR